MPPETAPLRKRLIEGSLFNLLASVFVQGGTLVTTVVVARLLMKQSFGEYAIVYSTLLTVAGISQLALGYTASKYVAEFRSSAPDKVTRIMGLCRTASVITAAAGTLLLVAISPWLTHDVLKAPHLTSSLILGGGFLFFSAVNGYQVGALSGLEAYRGLVRAGLISSLALLGAVSLGAWTWGLHGAVAGLSIGAFIRWSLHSRLLQLETSYRGIRPRYRGGFGQEKRIITTFALPAAISAYITLPAIWLANSLLVRQPGGYNDMALYASSFSLRTLALFVPQAMNSVSLSVLNNIKGRGDRFHYKRIYMASVSAMILLTMGSAAVLSFFGEAILTVFGKDFGDGKQVLRVLMLSTIFEAGGIALYQHLQVHEKVWTSLLLITIPRETLFIVLALYLVPHAGALGLGIAYTTGWAAALAVIASLIYYRATATEHSRPTATIL